MVDPPTRALQTGNLVGLVAGGDNPGVCTLYIGPNGPRTYTMAYKRAVAFVLLSTLLPFRALICPSVGGAWGPALCVESESRPRTSAGRVSPEADVLMESLATTTLVHLPSASSSSRRRAKTPGSSRMVSSREGSERPRSTARSPTPPRRTTPGSTRMQLSSRKSPEPASSGGAGGGPDDGWCADGVAGGVAVELLRGSTSPGRRPLTPSRLNLEMPSVTAREGEFPARGY